MILKGKVWKFGDDINTDVIYPGKHLAIFEPEEMAKHCFETIYPDFLKKLKKGDIIVAGKYFGCGSSREQAATCLKYAGIGCIIAESFARIYYRNAINQGLPILVCPGISKKIEQGHTIEVDIASGSIKNLTTGEKIQASRLPEFILGIISDGGLIPYVKKKLKRNV